jgi:hypothetical protein
VSYPSHQHLAGQIASNLVGWAIEKAPEAAPQASGAGGGGCCSLQLCLCPPTLPLRIAMGGLGSELHDRRTWSHLHFAILAALDGRKPKLHLSDMSSWVSLQARLRCLRTAPDARQALDFWKPDGPCCQ